MATPMQRSFAIAITACLAGLVFAGQSSAFNYVSDSNGTWWGIQDFAPPRVDTGSIRATQVGAGQTPAYSTTINGFGGIKVQVPNAPRFNGELMRGFGLEFNGADAFKTTTAVALGGVEISRAVWIKKELPVGTASYGRWLDTFTNTTSAPLTIKVAFGGQTGYSASGANSSALVNTSSGDTTIAANDTWAALRPVRSGVVASVAAVVSTLRRSVSEVAVATRLPSTTKCRTDFVAPAGIVSVFT